MEQTLFEKAGVQYKNVNGLLYPILQQEETDMTMVGKYGRFWMRQLLEVDRQCYLKWLMNGTLIDRAVRKNEDAYECIDVLTKIYLSKLDAKEKHSSLEMWKYREAAKATAEEIFFEGTKESIKMHREQLRQSILDDLQVEEPLTESEE